MRKRIEEKERLLNSRKLLKSIKIIVSNPPNPSKEEKPQRLCIITFLTGFIFNPMGPSHESFHLVTIVVSWYHFVVSAFSVSQLSFARRSSAGPPEFSSPEDWKLLRSDKTRIHDDNNVNPYEIKW